MTEMLKYDGHKLHKALFKKSTIIQHLCKLFDKLYWTTIFIFLTIRAYTTIYDGSLLIVKAILICSEAKRLYNNIQCRSLIAWNCSVLYTPSVIGWREVPALLTAGYKTDSTQRMFHCSLQLLSANNTVMEHLRLKNFFCLVEGGALNWFYSASCCWLEITRRYTICRPTHWLVPRFGHPQSLPHSSRGGGLRIRLRSIQGEGPEALWVFRSCNTGLTQLSSSVSERAFKRGMKRNAEWMADGALKEALQSCLTARMAEPQLKLTRGRGTRNMVLEYMTERLKMSHVFTGQKKRQCWL